MPYENNIKCPICNHDTELITVPINKLTKVQTLKIIELLDEVKTFLIKLHSVELPDELYDKLIELEKKLNLSKLTRFVKQL